MHKTYKYAYLHLTFTSIQTFFLASYCEHISQNDSLCSLTLCYQKDLFFLNEGFLGERSAIEMLPCCIKKAASA